MTFLIAARTELIKTRRSSAFWLSVLGAAFMPVIFFLMYTLKPKSFIPALAGDPWTGHFLRGWQSLAPFLLPMFVILSCSLITQIEYKNNTWKQVFASPQSIGAIFFSKFLAIHIMILFCFLLFNFFMIISALAVNVINKGYSFTHHAIDWLTLVKWSFKTYVSVLGICALQYWLSLRFKNFIVPIAIGLALLIASLALLQWEHIYKIPYAAPILTFMSIRNKSGELLQNHEWNAIGYFVCFTALAFLDLLNRKERG
jgi:hypothetical protein